MTERPILFSDAMARAILAGQKTQTRRLVGLHELKRSSTPGFDWTWRGRAPVRSIAQQRRHPGGCWQDVREEDLRALCPYGVSGDRLWVREAWCPRSNGALLMEKAQRPFFRATDGDGDMPKPHGWPWRPSIHMPRRACRLVLEVTEVRIERLQAITEDDARYEGVDVTAPTWTLEHKIGWADGSRRDGFRALWDSINGERAPWSSNPWVWVVAFRVAR